MSPKDPPVVSLAGKTAIVTGSNVGIGYATASYLASQKCHVVLACRTPSKAEDALASIKAKQPDASVEVMQLDLASLDSARKFADSWRARTEDRQRLDLLICNGGATFIDFEKTADGFERTYQTNYLTHFLLQRSLLPFLARSDDPRIVWVSSNSASWGKIDKSLDNLNAEQIPEASWKGVGRFKVGMQVYGNSKILQMLHTPYLQTLLGSSPSFSKIGVYAVYPGFVGSDMGKKDHYGFSKFITTPINFIVKSAGRSTDNGAKPSLWAALSDEAKSNRGTYFDEHCRKADWPNKLILDTEIQQALWERSCKDTGTSPNLE